MDKCTKNISASCGIEKKICLFVFGSLLHTNGGKKNSMCVECPFFSSLFNFCVSYYFLLSSEYSFSEYFRCFFGIIFFSVLWNKYFTIDLFFGEEYLSEFSVFFQFFIIFLLFLFFFQFSVSWIFFFSPRIFVSVFLLFPPFESFPLPPVGI